MENIAAVVLAGGKGTRMQSPKPKVLHKIGGQPMIFYALSNLYELGIKDIYAVVGFKANLVKQAVGKIFPVKFALQEKQLGTGHAVKTALNTIDQTYDHILVVNGDDSAFYSQATLRNFIESHINSKAVVSLMILKLGDQNKLGKIIKDENNQFLTVLEDQEYQDGGYQTDEVNCGAYLFDLSWLKNNINSITLNPIKQEYYINDLPNMAAKQGQIVNLFTLKDTKEWVGVNSQDELKYANLMMKERKFSTSLEQ